MLDVENKNSQLVLNNHSIKKKEAKRESAKIPNEKALEFEVELDFIEIYGEILQNVRKNAPFFFPANIHGRLVLRPMFSGSGIFRISM